MTQDRLKTAFEVLQPLLTIPDTLEFREKHLPEILQAMEEYAKIKSNGFAEWLDNNHEGYNESRSYYTLYGFYLDRHFT